MINMEIKGYKEVAREVWTEEKKLGGLYVVKHWLDQYDGLNKSVHYFIEVQLKE